LPTSAWTLRVLTETGMNINTAAIFRVDYFSLDIEGPELEVLETIPWDKVDISAISVETEFYGEFEDKKQAIKILLESQGEYTYIKKEAFKRDFNVINLTFLGNSCKRRSS
jgi:hypothetical protein